MSKVLCKKLHMTQIWKDDHVVPVTVSKVVAGDEEMLQEIKEGGSVTVRGLSKGKGFQGVVKRHGFHGGPKSHGQKHSLRAPGSIGAMGPQRTFPGKKMPGHMGMERVTIKRVVVDFDTQTKTISVKGSVPGMKGTMVELRTRN
ncbi:unnamed protein product [marine sediment metagenome]|uniref:50S ribosomal protein L3 n=1 Tax=marine sediment metagenome TaxID=412755 RepID=X1EXM1_9ZZZZ